MGLYAVKADLIDAYGAVNIFTWAKRDQTIADIDDPLIDATIDAALNKSDGDINGQFRDSIYAIPFALNDVASQATVKDWSVVISVWWLYKFRKVNAPNNPKTPTSNQIFNDEKRVRMEMKNYISGALRLDAALARDDQPTAPVVLF